MLGRALTFADPDVIAFATNSVIPVCTDDWYTRRRKDATGDFLRDLADQAGKKGEGDFTRQGIYLFTADGLLLAYKNAGQHPDVMKDVFRSALAKFNKLPKKYRTAGGIDLPEEGKRDPKYTRERPKDATVLRVHARILDREDGKLSVGTCKMTGGDKASRDFCWMTAPEMASLLPEGKTQVGQSWPMPKAIVQRLVRFHCVDNTRGEPSFWKASEVRHAEFTLTVTGVSVDELELRLDGTVLLSTTENPNKAERGYEASVRGELKYDRNKTTWSQCDVAVLGMHWGEHTHTGEARPGKSLLGIWFTLADTTKPSQTIWPQALRDESTYWGKD